MWKSVDTDVVEEVRSLSEEEDDEKCELPPKITLKRFYLPQNHCMHLFNGGRR